MATFRRPTITYPIIVAVTAPATDDLTTSFQSLDITDTSEPILTPQSSSTKPSSPLNPIRPARAIMNSIDLSMTFDGVNPKKIDVWMYIQNAETKAMVMALGQDKGKLGLCQLIFFTGLKGVAKQWFEGLSTQVQDDWQLLKADFNEKYNKNNQTLQQYIAEADQLADSLNQQADKNAVGFLADFFINGIINEYHQHLIKITLPSEIYTYDQAKSAAEKVINSSSKVTKLPVATIIPT
ncbi:MAG: hypothetical protein M1839_004612 [Geoglossum umbratile]|nr:MAG: hypothetical protein M1839_004612 [Geoglossum umbratile]